ncbi:MAG: hypothetical protein GY734_21900 [Herbaspirillum sp.]|uniref:hypothetical protein n=1 Tax=Herbaspirillum sp. TaxID=1890675 RepID=UPI00258C872E|nr:hypothetical protein [Herbaspirillum sp.]MCL4419410.1 hypothetical protein [Patescibacteria group bacterium]MCP3658521.1 hypothetical protein [Herbaspirillum sp.]MCP4033874.1 hypothetical protein [Herbaspirillum sp.]
MSKENYVWAWKDDDGVYVNTAKSLEAIVEEIIEFYKEDEIEELTVELNDQIIDISFFEDGNETEWEIKAVPWVVAKFLQDLAGDCGHEDWFDIKEIEAESNRADTFEIEKI